ncbi:DUF1294 domain-containing protein [Anaerobacillus sp. MEB173]|uniref:DUF1294 domain-containing protein n=1 Tax=Anaerobacillus sp. MEB173 TaxID=3383345 RepID=UPI003F91156C
MTNAFLFTYIVIVNGICIGIMGVDKAKAKKGQWRISEATMFIWALLGGAAGIYLGMKLYRHKTKKLKFKLFMPLLSVVQLVFIAIIITSF